MAQQIGIAKVVKGQMNAVGPEGSRTLSEGNAVFKGDTVSTAKSSGGSIEFTDKTVLNVGEGSKISLDQYVYNADKGSGQVLFKMAQGTFRAVTGEIVKQNPESFKLQSPLATIGIRGTETAHTIPLPGQGSENHLIMVFDGKPVVVQPLGGGAFQVLSQSGVKVEVNQFGAGPVLIMTPQEFKYFQALTPTGMQQGVPTDTLSTPPGQQSGVTNPVVKAAQDAAAKAQADAAAKAAEAAAAKAAAEAAAKAAEAADPAAKAAADAAAKAAAEAAVKAAAEAKAAADAASKAAADAFAAQQALALAEAAKAAADFAAQQGQGQQGQQGFSLMPGTIFTIGSNPGGQGNGQGQGQGQGQGNNPGGNIQIIISGGAQGEGGDGETGVIDLPNIIINLPPINIDNSISLIGESSGQYVTLATSGDSVDAPRNTAYYEPMSNHTLWEQHSMPSDELVKSVPGTVTNVYGSPWDDTIKGNDAVNAFYGNAGADTIYGYGAADFIEGGAGQDTIYGGLGNDIIDGGDDNDTINGEEGDDLLSGGAGADTIDGGLGNDAINGGEGNDSLSGGGGNDIMDGGLGNDTVSGGDGSDIINASEGDDTIDAGADNDNIYMGTGLTPADSVEGGTGTDTLHFVDSVAYTTELDNVHGVENVTLSNTDTNANLVFHATQTGNDQFISGMWDDIGNRISITGANIDGGHSLTFDGSHVTQYGAFTISGGHGNDTITGSASSDDGHAHAIGDIISGGDGNDTINGLAGNDTLSGDCDNDIIKGGDGDDLIKGGHGNDTLYGGTDLTDTGTDSLSYAGEYGGQGIVVNVAAGTTADTYGTTDTTHGFELAIGSSYNDTILLNQAQLETVRSIDAGGGTNDTLQVTNANADLRTNVETQAITFTNMERVLLDGTANAVTATFSDTQVNANSTWKLDSTGSNNTTFKIVMEGAALDASLLTFGSGWGAGGGTDTVRIEDNETSNTIVGSSSGDTITSTGGDDNISAADGDDTVVAHSGGTGYLLATDTIDGGAGYDTLEVGSGSGDLTDWDHVTNFEKINLNGTTTIGITAASTLATSGKSLSIDASSMSGAGVFNFTGTAASGNLTILGTANNDTLIGGGGNDSIEGGAGNDTLTGGGGTDTVSYAHATGGVTVNLWNNTAQDTMNAGTDTMDGFENLLGSAHGDTLTGTTGANEIWGGDGNDTIDGKAGNDTLHGGAGTDAISFQDSNVEVTLNLATTTSQSIDETSRTIVQDGFENIIGSNYNDILTGNSGNNVFYAGSGAVKLYGVGGDDTFEMAWNDGVGTLRASDTIDGGVGTDTINYRWYTGSASTDWDGVTNVEVINVAGSSATTITAATTLCATGQSLTINASTLGDSFSFDGENVTGALTITGSANNDTLIGGSGADTLHGGDGDDILAGRGGVDDLWGDGGTDTASYGTATGAVTANLLTGIVSNDGFGSSDTLHDIENINGSANYGDTITGGSGVNQIDAMGGDDSVSMGQYLTAADVVHGGTGTDTLTFTDANGDATDLDGVDGFEHLVIQGATASVAATDALFTNVSGGSWNPMGSAISVDGSQLTGTLTFDATDVSNGYLYIKGSAGNDTITGSNSYSVAGNNEYSNKLFGGVGADTISGASTSSYADMFIYKTLAEAGDTITNFTSTVDKFAFYGTGYGGEFHYNSTAAIAGHVFANSGLVTGSEACWYSDGTNLIYDSNGVDANGTTTIASGVTTVAEADIVIVNASHMVV